MVLKNNESIPAVLRLLLAIQKGDRDKELLKIPQKTVFILSTGRTGTKFFADVFCLDTRVYAVHEPKPSRGFRFFTYARLEGDISEQQMEEVLKKYRSNSFTGMTEEIYIESNNFLAGFVNTLKYVFHDPIIIHVVRDPRDYVRSIINHGGDTGLKGLANKYIPYANFSKKFIKRSYSGSNKLFARSALYWRNINEYLEKAGEGYPQYHIFKFEDIFASNSDSLQQIADIIGVDISAIEDLNSKEKKVNASRLDVIPIWQEWTYEECKIVNDICGELMQTYGYGKEALWRRMTG